MKVIWVNIGMMMFRGGGENFDINVSKALMNQDIDTEIYSLVPVVTNASFLPPEHFESVTLVKTPWLYPITAFLHRYNFTRSLKGLRGVPRVFGQVMFELNVFVRLALRRKEEFVVITCALPLLACLLDRFMKRKAYVRMPGPIENIYDGFFAKRATGIIANGDAYKRIKDLGVSNLHHVNVGVHEFEGTTPDEVRAIRVRNGIQRNEVLMLFVGRLIPIKNVPLLLEAWASAVERGVRGKLLLVGDGPARDAVDAEIRRLAIDESVELVGFVGKRVLGGLYSAANCCLLSSVYDNFPNVLIESLSCGTPCIATDVGAVSDIVQDGVNGYLVPSNNVEAFTEAIVRIYKNSSQWDRNAIMRNVRSQFSWSRATAKLLGVCCVQ